VWFAFALPACHRLPTTVVISVVLVRLARFRASAETTSWQLAPCSLASSKLSHFSIYHRQTATKFMYHSIADRNKNDTSRRGKLKQNTHLLYLLAIFRGKVCRQLALIFKNINLNY